MMKFKNDRAKGNVHQGFTLIELVIVVAILLILTAIAIPAIRQTTASYQLDASGQVVASTLQGARMAAVKANMPYYASFVAGSAPNLVTAAPFELRGYSPGTDPTGATVGAVVFQAPNGLDIAQLTQFLGGVAPTTNGVIGFNGRGLPCVAGVNQFVCTPVGAGGFAWFMQSLRNNGWEAVTISPTGHIRCWRQTAAGVWQ